MINKANRSLSAIYGDATNHIASIFPIVNREQGVAVNYLEILNFQAINGINLVDHMVVGFLNGMCAGIVDTLFQRFIDGRGNGSLVGRKQSVAAALGKAISIAHNGALHNLHIHADIFHQLLDNSNLLPVFLTEVSTVGADNVEQTAHNLTNTIEMARALSTFHHRADWGELKLACIGRRIHLFYRWSQHIVGTHRLE